MDEDSDAAPVSIPENSWCAAVFENAFDIIMMADARGRFEYVNPAACRAFGYTQQELLSLSISDVLAPSEGPRLLKLVNSLALNDVSFGEWISRRKDGSLFPSEVSVMRMSDAGLIGIGRDITERVASHMALARSKERLAVAMEVASIGEWEMDLETLATTTSKLHDRIFGYEDAAPPWSYRVALQHVVEEDRSTVESAFHLALKLGEGHLQCRIRRPNGEIRWIELHGRRLRGSEGDTERAIGAVLDITEQKSLENEEKYAARLRGFGEPGINGREVSMPADASGSLYELCWTYARDAMVVAELDTRRVVGMNPQAEELLGYREEALVGAPVEQLHPESEHDRVRELFELGPLMPPLHSGLHVKRKNGVLVPVEIRASRVWNLGGHPVIVGIFRDLSDVENRDQRLSTAAFALRAYAAAAIALLQADTPTGLMEQVCGAITRDSPFGFAWVGLAEQDAACSIRVLASAGVAGNYLDDLRLSWSEATDTGRGPSGIAIRTGEAVIIDDCISDERFAPWRERAKLASFVSLVSVPFQMEERPAVLNVYSSGPQAFESVVVEAFRHLAKEIGVGVTTLIQRERLNAERQKTEAAQRDLARALDGVIGAISTAMETRDPYTAGHQRRVADIAAAIARELQWSQDRVDALRVAALVHDIGKIAIPAEILTRSTGLRKAEWLLMKEHAQTGYEILKDIPFDWPVAEAVRQHHERMDGSGYPRGLHGDQIIVGARILAVADVLEATASRRPYRAARGVEKAVAEIERQAGTKLDVDVVRICAALFREKATPCPG